MILFQVRTKTKTSSAYHIFALFATSPMLDPHTTNMWLIIDTALQPQLAGFRLIYWVTDFSLLLQLMRQILVSSILQQTCNFSSFWKGTISSYLPCHTDSFLTCMHRKSDLRMNNCKFTTLLKHRGFFVHSCLKTWEEKPAIITFTFPCNSHWILCCKENALGNSWKLTSKY